MSADGTRPLATAIVSVNALADAIAPAPGPQRAWACITYRGPGASEANDDQSWKSSGSWCDVRASTAAPWLVSTIHGAPARRLDRDPGDGAIGIAVVRPALMQHDAGLWPRPFAVAARVRRRAASGGTQRRRELRLEVGEPRRGVVRARQRHAEQAHFRHVVEPCDEGTRGRSVPPAGSPAAPTGAPRPVVPVRHGLAARRPRSASAREPRALAPAVPRAG